jgi:ferritin-like metal-binding protein YciE
MIRIRFDGCDLSRAARDTPVVRVYGSRVPGRAGAMTEPLATPRELLAACLRQMLWVEQQLADQVLPELSERVHSIDLKRSFDRHRLETEGHVRTVRYVLDDLDLPAEPEESPAFRGLVAEHEQLVRRCESPVMCDLAHAVAALAAEHLELATYEALVSVAESAGEEDIGIRLREVLEQEEFALEQVEGAMAKLLAEKVESERL